jgi:hypothetical protein
MKAEIEVFTGENWDTPSYPEILEWTKSYDEFSINKLKCYEYLAHLRHRGFPSPLLDWTRSLYVAAYFAFARARSESGASQCQYLCF